MQNFSAAPRIAFNFHLTIADCCWNDFTHHGKTSHHHHRAQWLVNLYQKKNSTITHSIVWWEIVSAFFFSARLSTIARRFLMLPFDGNKRNLFEIFTLYYLFSFGLQMHSRFLMFVWRKKLFLFATGILMVLAILLWGFVYSSHVNHDDIDKGLSIKVKSGKFLSLCQFA